jgi:hemerythrin-like metal-binding protein
MNSDQIFDSGELDVGNPEMDRDHHELAQLIEKVGSVCACLRSRGPVCNSDECPDGTAKVCFAALGEISHEIMVRMLDHFHHEHELMNSLPSSHSSRQHCITHRQEHVNFSTRYNQLVTSFNPFDPLTGMRDLDSFITDWVRSHILEFDVKLAALLKG